MRNFTLFSVVYSLILILTISAVSGKSGIYNIVDFGAIKNEKSTAAIQTAIETCARNGGGTIYVPPGEFITGTIRLRDNINLFLEAGAILTGSLDTMDYRLDGTIRGMIIADEVRDISITGLGELNGNGTAFMNLQKNHFGTDFDRKYTRQGENYMPASILSPDGPVAYPFRPGMMVVILKCENVLIENVTFRDSPEWTIRLGDCDNAKVQGISIQNNLLVPNSDGIHCTTSRNVRISNCDIRAGDDAIIITGFGDEISVHGKNFEPDFDYVNRKIGNKTGFAENITVTNCLLQSRSSGIRVGYGDNSMRNCVFENLVIYGSNRGIGIFCRDRGNIENIQFSNIFIETRLHTGHWWGNGEPIHVSAIPQKSDVPVGKIRNIRFFNITAKSENGILIYGVQESKIENLTLENIRLNIQSSPLNATYGGNFDLRPTNSKSTSIFKHDIPGLYSQFVKDLKIKDFEIKFASEFPDFFSNAIECQNFENLIIDEFCSSSSLPVPNHAIFHLQDGKNVIIRNSVVQEKSDLFLSHQNVSGGCKLSGNDFSKVKTIIKPESSVFQLLGN
jgi:polygalacturonase